LEQQSGRIEDVQSLEQVPFGRVGFGDVNELDVVLITELQDS
jgi:hypothetical protein